jgi:hypothetical protein
MDQARRKSEITPGVSSVERVDPFDHPHQATARLTPSPVERAQMQLGELRSRIDELDAEVAGLLAQREALTRVAFELASASSLGPRLNVV